MKTNARLGFAIYIGIVGIGACILMLWVTPYGAGVSPDSTVYAEAARSLLAGTGFSSSGNPVTHYPPLFPLLLAASSGLNHNLVQAARFLNAVLFGLNIGLVASAVYFGAGRSYLTTTVAAFFCLSSAPLIVLHAWMWSEPLFIMSSLASVILLAAYVNRPSWILLAASSIAMGSAILTRYIGGAFVPAAMALLLLEGGRRHVSSNLRRALIWLAITGLPIGLLLASNTIMTGSATDRTVAFHPIPAAHFSALVATTALDFVSPASIPSPLRLIVNGLFAGLLVAQLAIYAARRGNSIDWHAAGVVLAVACFLFSAAYLAGLFLSTSFLDAATPVNSRLLSPIYVLLVVGVIAAEWAALRALAQPALWWCFLVLLAVSISLREPEAVRAGARIQANGLMYTSKPWLDSQAMGFLRSFPRDTVIYSNGPDAVQFLAQKRALPVPEKVSPTTLQANHDYAAQVEVMCEDISKNGALLAYFDALNWRWYFPTIADLEVACPVPILQRFADGTIYAEEQK